MGWVSQKDQSSEVSPLQSGMGLTERWQISDKESHTAVRKRKNAGNWRKREGAGGWSGQEKVVNNAGKITHRAFSTLVNLHSHSSLTGAVFLFAVVLLLHPTPVVLTGQPWIIQDT